MLFAESDSPSCIHYSWHHSISPGLKFYLSLQEDCNGLHAMSPKSQIHILPNSSNSCSHGVALQGLCKIQIWACLTYRIFLTYRIEVTSTIMASPDRQSHSHALPQDSSLVTPSILSLPVLQPNHKQICCLPWAVLAVSLSLCSACQHSVPLECPSPTIYQIPMHPAKYNSGISVPVKALKQS